MMNLNTILEILEINKSKSVDEILDCIIMYLRKSRRDMDYFKDEPIEKTLQRHEKELQEMIVRIFGKPLPSKNIYKEVVSGDTIEERPMIQEVLSKIENSNIKVVVCIEIERLARGNTIDQGTIAQAFKYTRTKIWTPSKIFNLDLEDDLSYFEDGLYQSRKYLVYIKRILSRGRVRSVKDGKYICSTRPYGYIRKKITNDKGFTLEILEEEAKIVRLIFDLAYNDKGTSKIANELNELGVKPMKNDVWTPACVRNILNSPVYIGKNTWNRRKTVSTLKNGKIVKSRPRNDNYILVNGLHKPIIDEALYNEVQKKLKLKSTPKLKTTEELKNPLAGIVKCGICGRNMIRRPYMSGYKDGLICGLSHCKNISSHLQLVEERLIESLQEMLSEYKNKAVEYQKEIIPIKDTINKIDLLKKEITAIDKQISKACELLEQEIYSPDMFIKRKNELENKKIEILEKIKIEEKEKKKNKNEEIINYIPKIENCLQLYDKSTIEEKNKLLHSIIDNVEYIKVKGGRGYEDNFTLKIKPKI